MPKKKKARLNMRMKLAITYLIVLLVPSLVIGGMTYRTASQEVQNQLFASGGATFDTANEIVDNTISSKINDINYFVDAVSSATVNSDNSGPAYAELKDRLKEYAAMHPDVLEVYVGTDKGGIVSASDESLPGGYDIRKEEAYVNAIKRGQGIVVSPVLLNENKEPVVSLSSVLKDGEGVFILQMNLKQLAQLVDMKVGQRGYIFIIDSSKKFVVHPTETAGQEAKYDFIKKMYEKDSGSFQYTYNGVSKYMIYKVNELTGWRIASTIDKSEVGEASSGIRTTFILVIAISVVLAGVLIIFVIRSLLKPLRRLGKATEVISQGDLSQEIGEFGRDEIGELAENFRTMVANLRQMIMSVQEMTDNVSSSAAELTAGAEQTTKTIEHVTIAIQEVAAGSERQIKSVRRGMEGTAATAEEVDHLSGYMDEVSAVMTKTSETAAAGNDSIIEVVDKINGINETVEELGSVIESLNKGSERIVGIVGLIKGIARQTNLLALNASIEAARAGEQGRGFAVVAAEVRKLAEESEKSASEIAVVIEAIHGEMKEAAVLMDSAKEKVSEGIVAVDTSGRSFSRIRKAIRGAVEKIQAMGEGVRTLSSEAGSMKAAMEEIQLISDETSESTETISAAAQEQLASVEEIASSSADLSRLADELQTLVSRFKLYDEKGTGTAENESAGAAEATAPEPAGDAPQSGMAS